MLTYTHTHSFIHTYITYIDTHIETHIHTYTYIHTCGHTYIHRYMHTFKHTYLHIFIHTYVQTHSYAHTSQRAHVEQTTDHIICDCDRPTKERDKLSAAITNTTARPTDTGNLMKRHYNEFSKFINSI
jgi:hypothetical protein